MWRCVNGSPTDSSDVVDVSEEPNVEYTEVLHPETPDPARGNPIYLSFLLRILAWNVKGYLAYARTVKPLAPKIQEMTGKEAIPKQIHNLGQVKLAAQLGHK